MDSADRHERLLRRAQWLWDRVSHLDRLMGRAAAEVGSYALEHLDLRDGQAVLDIGCGSGAALPALRAVVGPSGRVVGIDNSPRMLARAQRRILAHHWDNVQTRQADFTRTEIEPARFDAAIAVFSLSAMPDVPAALTTAHTALRPGGRLFVIDMRLVAADWSAPLIWLIQGLYRALAGWSGVDVLDTARAAFPTVTLPDPPGKPGRGQPATGWPPLTMFVATKAPASRPTHAPPAQAAEAPASPRRIDDLVAPVEHHSAPEGAEPYGRRSHRHVAPPAPRGPRCRTRHHRHRPGRNDRAR